MAAIRPDNNPEVETRLLRTLYELSMSAGRTPDPGELVQAVVEQACELLDGDAVALYLWDDAAGLLMPVFSNDPRQPAEDQPLRPGEGAAGQAILQRQPVLIEDYQNWPHAISGGVSRELQSVQAVPLMVSDGPVGALIIRFYNRKRVFSPDQLRTLLLLAAQVAPALEAARLYATSTLERQHERALREITQALAANLDERQVLDLAVTYSAQLLKAPYARVWLLERNNQLSCAAAEGFVHADTFKRRLPGDSTSGLVARQKILNLHNAPTETSWRFNREFGERTGLGSYLGAGLWRAGESLGVLEVMRQTGHRFSGLEEQLLMTLASAVAVAVSNARTHATLQRLAQEAEQRAEAVAESELMLRSIYEAIGSGVLVFDDHGVIINANAAAGEILGRSVDSLLGMTTDEFLPTFREDGSPLPPEERPYPRVLAEGGPMRKYVFGISRPDGQRRWLQADAVPLWGPAGSVPRVITSFIDITDQKRSEAALRQRDAILEGVAFAAEQLLRASEWEHSIDDVLAQLGTATGVSRVSIMPGFYDGTRDTSAYHWTAPGIEGRPQSTVHGPYLGSIGLPRWEPMLRAGGTIQGRIRSFPLAEQAVLESHGVCSIMVVPIFDGDAWWGFIAFEDCTEERVWPAGTVEVLKTAAGTLGAAILRRRADAERMQLVREQS
ncbi:MAG TPA: GAF domain-containing protein, partial [Chloroflexota bacterium]|nr:GAF domain-containing protein [Chloroflexota bacterium]